MMRPGDIVRVRDVTDRRDGWRGRVLCVQTFRRPGHEWQDVTVYFDRDVFGHIIARYGDADLELIERRGSDVGRSVASS